MRLRTVLAAAASFACIAAPLAAKTPVKAPVKHHKAVVRHHVPGPAGVSIAMDEVRVVTFQRPINTVFVGNPTIADAT